MKLHRFGFLLLLLMSMSFTVVDSSRVQGFSDSTLTVYYNASQCGVSESELLLTIGQAIELWNSVPNSKIKLQLGTSVNFTATEVYNGTFSGLGVRSVVACDPNLVSAIHTNVDNIAAISSRAYTGNVISYGFVLINSTTTAAARFQNLDSVSRAVVVAHELGHVLGLGHSSATSSLMYFDTTSKTELRLSQDDMDGIAYLYPRNEFGGSGLGGCN